MTQRTGRPSTDPAKLAAALERVRAGEPVVEVARAMGLAKTVLYEARKAAPVAPSPTPLPPVPTPPASETRIAGGTEADDLAIIDAEIDASREQLRGARAEGKTHGVAAMQKNLLDLIRRRRELRPPPPPNADDEERRWRAAADRVLMKIDRALAASALRRRGAA